MLLKKHGTGGQAATPLRKGSLPAPFRASHVCLARAGFEQFAQRQRREHGDVDDFAKARQGGAGGREKRSSRDLDGGQPGTIDYRPRSERRSGGTRQNGGGNWQRGLRNEGTQGEQQEGAWQRLSPEQLAARTNLNQEVKTARGWRALGVLVAEKGSAMDAEHISTIMQKMSREQRPSQEDDGGEYDRQLSTLLGWLLALMPTFRPRHTVMNLNTLSKMQLYSPEVMNGLLDKAKAQLVNFQAYELPAVVKACSLLNHQPSPEFMAEFEARTLAKLANMKFTDLVSMLSGLHALNALPVGKPWMDSAMQALEQKALALPDTYEKAKELDRRQGLRSNNSQYQSQEEGTRDATEGETSGRPQRGQRDGGRFVRAADRDPNDISLTEYLDAVMLLANIAKDTGYQPSQSLVDAMFTRLAWRVGGVPVDVASRVLWAVSNLTARPGLPWFGKLLDGIARRDRSWQPAEISTICLYLSRYLQVPATPFLAQKLIRYTEDEKFFLGPSGVSNVLYLLAISGYRPPERWLDDVNIWLKENLDKCTATDLEHIYNSLPTLGEGFRLQELVNEAGARYQALMGATGESTSE